MYRFLISRQWLGGLAFAVAAAMVCVLLGWWQWTRLQDRRDRNAVVIANYDAEPVALSDVLAPGQLETTLATDLQWRPVRVQGQYLPQATTLIRNRPLDGSAGYRIIVPFVLTEDGYAGRILLVDRGWVPTGETAAAPDDVPSPPSGQVRVVARLRPTEEPDDKQAPAGQAHRIVPAVLAADVHARCSDCPGPPTAEQVMTWGYAMMAEEDPAASTAPVALPKPALDEGPHLSYAMQWVAFALLFLGGWVVFARRRAEDLAWEQEHGRRAPERRRRVRPGSDEAVEDAQVEAATDHPQRHAESTHSEH